MKVASVVRRQISKPHDRALFALMNWKASMMMNRLSVSILFLGLLFALDTTVQVEAALLEGNTRGDVPISSYDGESSFTSFLPEDIALVAPDHLVLNDETYLYISHGDSVNNSGIFRMNVKDGSYEEMFASGGGLIRPYGFDIFNGTLYVASFMSDQVLMYDEETGDYLGEFAAGNGTEEGLCNGPNQIAIYDGKLYLTTQGSMTVDGAVEYKFSSQVVVYDIESKVGSVYTPPPEVLEGSLGYVSMLGVIIGCNEQSAVEDDCTMYTTDFAGGLRAYKLSTAELIYATGTTIDGSSTGSLTMTPFGMIVVPIFTNEASGSLLQFNAITGKPMGTSDETAVLAEPTENLSRPIGVLYRRRSSPCQDSFASIIL